MQKQDRVRTRGEPQFACNTISKRLANKSNGAINRDDLRRVETASGSSWSVDVFNGPITRLSAANLT